MGALLLPMESSDTYQSEPPIPLLGGLALRHRLSMPRRGERRQSTAVLLGTDLAAPTVTALRSCKVTRPQAPPALLRTTDLAPAWIFHRSGRLISRSPTAEARTTTSIHFLSASQ